MLCVPAEAPDGTSGGPAQGTNPRKHETKLGMGGVCTEQASTPHQEHASARGDTIDTRREGVTTAPGCCALRLCWFKRGWTLDVHSVDGHSPFATDEAPSWRPDVAVRVGTVAMLEWAFCVL